jgi:hypothetical protein
MQNIFTTTAEKLSSIKKGQDNLVSKSVNSIKKDISYYNCYTELFFIWTVLFTSITGLFFLATKNNVLIVLLLLISAFAITLAGTVATIFYLHALKYQNGKRLLPRIHNLLNKSFKVRNIFRLIKIPRFSVFTSIARNFKLAS